jgi:hypothetical protein
MNISFDPQLIAKARELILHQPDLDVLRPEEEVRHPVLVRAIQRELKARDAAGKQLLLPDLSALSNRTMIGPVLAVPRHTPASTLCHVAHLLNNKSSIW